MSLNGGNREAYAARCPVHFRFAGFPAGNARESFRDAAERFFGRPDSFKCQNPTTAY